MNDIKQGVDEVAAFLGNLDVALRDKDFLMAWHWLDHLSDAITALVRERDLMRQLIDAFARYADGRCDHFLDVAMRDLYRYRSEQGGPFFPASDEDLSIETLRKERDAAQDEIEDMRPVVEAVVSLREDIRKLKEAGDAMAAVIRQHRELCGYRNDPLARSVSAWHMTSDLLVREEAYR